MFDKQKCREVTEKAKKALEGAFAGSGIGVRFGRGTFSFKEFTTKIEFIALEEGKSTEETAFAQSARLVGLTPEDYGRVIRIRGEQYKLVAIKPNNHKYPIIGESLATGKRFKFQMTDVVASTIPNLGKKELPEGLFEQFEILTCQLSPENLSCDGELSRAQVQSRLLQIKREWQTLEVKAGRSVSQDEIERRSMEKYLKAQ